MTAHKLHDLDRRTAVYRLVLMLTGIAALLVATLFLSTSALEWARCCDFVGDGFFPESVPAPVVLSRSESRSYNRLGSRLIGWTHTGGLGCAAWVIHCLWSHSVDARPIEGKKMGIQPGPSRDFPARRSEPAGIVHPFPHLYLCCA